MTLSGVTTSGQSGPGSDGNEEVLRIPQSPSITGTSPSDCLVSHTGHKEVVGYPTAPADWAMNGNNRLIYLYINITRHYIILYYIIY